MKESANLYLLKFLILLPLLSQVSGASYIDAFNDMQGLLSWPTPASPRSFISSTFGPRAKSSCGGCYDFHRGIDIHGQVGDQLVAVAPGIVEDLKTYTSGGLTVILRHEFSEPVVFSFGKPAVARWYSFYMHMSEWSVAKGDHVAAGDPIGLMGMTGSTVNPHLHLEIRVGTSCSLEYALENEGNTCNTLEVDPHVHPLLATSSPEEPNSISAQVLQELDVEQDSIVRVEMLDTNPNLNKYHIEVVSNDGASVARLEHTLDLNMRTGFDASSTAAIDTPDTSVPHLNPVPFGYTSSAWKIDLVIPYSWVGEVGSGERLQVRLTDIWNMDLADLTIKEGGTTEQCDDIQKEYCLFGIFCFSVCRSIFAVLFQLFGFTCSDGC